MEKTIKSHQKFWITFTSKFFKKINLKQQSNLLSDFERTYGKF